MFKFHRENILGLYPFASRRGVARVFSTFLCAIAIVVRPFSQLGGSTAFLVLTLKELVFSCQGTLAQQIELTSLNILGASFAISISTLANFLAVNTSPEESLNARVIPAVFLAFISFFAGWIKSRFPRLQMSMRIACFVSIWLLTSVNMTQNQVWPDAGNYTWITLTAAIICLLSSMVVLRWSCTQFADETVSVLSHLHQSLSLGLDTAFTGNTSAITTQNSLHERLLKKSLALNVTYSQAAYEVRLGKVGVKSIKPLIGIVENIRRELSWGMTLSHSPFVGTNVGDSAISAFKNSATGLGNAILLSISATQQVVTETFKRTSSARISLAPEKYAVSTAQELLLSAQRAAREQLRKSSDSLDLDQRSSEGRCGFPPEFFNLCLFIVSLLQISDDMLRALKISHTVACLHEDSRRQLWLPHLSWAWLGSAPKIFILEEKNTITVGEMMDMNSRLSTETQENLITRRLSATSRRGAVERYGTTNVEDKDLTVFSHLVEKGMTDTNQKPVSRFTWSQLYLAFPWAWGTPFVLRIRLLMSKALKSIKHSSHLRHALKNAVGVAALSVPAFLPVGSKGHLWFEKMHMQWLVISYVWVLEVNTGATLRTAYLRLSGTTIGAIYAYVTWLICRTNPYGIVIMVTLADIPASWIVINTSFAPLGVVANVTLPPIVFAEYFDPTKTNMLETALLRGLMIGGGIIAALIMNMFVFPRHCRALFLDSTSRALGLLSRLFMVLGRDMIDHPTLTPDDKLKYLKLEVQTRKNLSGLSLLIVTMRDELSLLPKPVKLYQQAVQRLQKLLDLMTGLRQVRENIPRKDSVACVFKQQRELVSCICVSLFACEQVFRARQPLPQFLPSSEQALKTLESHISAKIRQERADDDDLMGLSLVYAYAESEIMKSVVDTMEELLEISRDLFGSSAWLTTQQPWVEIRMSEEALDSVVEG